jgi:hypothetical protein
MYSLGYSSLIVAEDCAAAVLLTEIEGEGFPSDESLAGWHGRKGEIQQKLAMLLKLAGSDPSQRVAVVELILASESMAGDDDDAKRVIERTRGESRAWMRRVLRTYEVFGVTQEDKKAISGDLVTEFRKTWNDVGTPHPKRSLQLYRAKAAQVRQLMAANCLDDG